VLFQSRCQCRLARCRKTSEPDSQALERGHDHQWHLVRMSGEIEDRSPFGIQQIGQRRRAEHGERGDIQDQGVHDK
jgi:hypothetical protein